MKKWKKIGVHKWIKDANITESVLVEDGECQQHRFTATICGWNNFHIWQGKTHNTSMKERTDQIIKRVSVIRDRIISGDESVFSEKGAW